VKLLTSSVVRLKPDTTSVVRLKPDTTSVVSGSVVSGFSRTVIAIALALVAVMPVYAQRGGGRGGPPPAAREAAALDLTGNWVSVVVEDWKWRMVTPKKGVYDSLPLNAEARKVADSWDPAKDEAAGEQCRAYGAANVMRLPGRLRIAWEDGNTLRIDTDAGTQTRLLRFGPAAEAVRQKADTTSGDPSWQGLSVAQWEYAAGGRGAARTGNMKVVTTNMRPGYVRKNGAPYSAKAVVTEFYDLNTMPNGDQWMTITTKVEDPVYFTRPYLTTTDFKKLRDAAGWNPSPCSAR
jgi:hypothetical protein